MRREDFQAIVDQHKGLRDDPVVLDPEKETQDRYGRTSKGPNPTPKYRYIFNDGTTLDAITQPGGDVQIVNPGTALNKSAVGADGKAPETKTFPDGSERQWDPSANGGKGDWVIIATKPQGPKEDENKPVEIGGQLVQRQPDGSYKPVYTAPSAKNPDAALPGLGNAPAARPGQTTDLDLVYAQGDQFLASLNNDVAAGRITPQERAAKWDTYKRTVIEPAHAQAQAEAKAEMDRQAQRQRDADARAARTEERQNRSEDRLATAQDRQAAVAEDRLSLDKEKASYERGQDAVSNALKLLQYQVDPSFGPDLAGVYNRIIPGAFQPGSFTTQAPDLDAIAAAHVGPILDLHNAPVAQPGTQGVAAAAPPAVPPGYGPRTAPPPMPPAQGPLPYQQPGATGYANRFGQ